MSKTTQFSIHSICVLMFSLLSLSAQADYFETRDLIPYSGLGSVTGATIVQFGGCEVGSNCYTTSDSDYHKTMWVIGDLNVKQGIYYLPVADEHSHGKLVLNYLYKFITEETSNSNSTDEGIIKLKNIDTEEIYYKKVITPRDEDANQGWRSIRVALRGSVATKNLQLVFETINDEGGLSVLYIKDCSFRHISQAAIAGTVTYKVSGKTFYADNALVALQNKNRTKTIAYTRTNERGEYTFFPVKSKRSYVIAATINGYDGLKHMHRKVNYGDEYNFDLNLR